jgi:hypothetical protein
VGATTVAKAALTGVALGVTAYSGMLGRKLGQAEGAPVEGDTPPDTASTRRQPSVCQWIVLALTGSMIVLDALHGEKQRPTRGLSGILAELADHLHRGDGLKLQRTVLSRAPCQSARGSCQPAVRGEAPR